MSQTRIHAWVASILATMASLLAVVMALHGAASWLEAIGFLTGAACVWLTVRESIWNFPVGMVNVSTFCVVFVRAGLYADAGLQVIYLVLCAAGWYLWLHGGRDRTRLHVTRASRREIGWAAGGIVVLTSILWPLLLRAGGTASFWDALTTALSLGAQWLLNRKRLECWIGWIVVDVIYVPLYCSKALYLTAVLYVIFLGLAAEGLRQWREAWRARRDDEAADLAATPGDAAT